MLIIRQENVNDHEQVYNVIIDWDKFLRVNII